MDAKHLDGLVHDAGEESVPSDMNRSHRALTGEDQRSAVSASHGDRETRNGCHERVAFAGKARTVDDDHTRSVNLFAPRRVGRREPASRVTVGLGRELDPRAAGAT